MTYLMGRAIRYLIVSFGILVVVVALLASFGFISSAKAQVPSALLPQLKGFIQKFDLAEQEELLCLSLAVYYEAKSSTKEDLAQVAITILNRVKHPRWPKTICGVVYQAGQFDWNRSQSHRQVPRETANWEIAQEVAFAVYSNPDHPDNCKGSHSFYSRRVFGDVSGPWGTLPPHRRCLIGGHVYVR